MKISPATRAVVIGAVGIGLAGVVAVLLWDRTPASMTGAQWAVAAVVGVVLFANWVSPMLLFRTNASEAFHLDEGLFVVLVLLVPAVVTMVIFVVSVSLTQLVRRRPLVKMAFNIGQVAGATGAGLLIDRAVAPFTAVPHTAQFAAALLGAAAYFVLNSGLVGAIMVSMGATWRSCLVEGQGARLALSVAGVVTGILLATASSQHPWAIGLTFPVVFGLRQILSAQFKSQHDRTRMQGLFNIALDANRWLRQDSVLESILQSAREELRCAEAQITSVDPGQRPDQLAVPMDVGGNRQWLAVSGRRREEPFDHADRILLEAVAAIARNALTNAELYRQVRYERSRLASITLNIGEGVCAVDGQGNLTFVNPAAAEMVHLPPLASTIGDSVSRNVMRAPDFLMGPALEAMRTGGVIRVDDARFPKRQGGSLPVAYTASAVKQNDEVVGAVISFRDITEQKRLHEERTQQALYDSLTGLANRRLLVSRLEHALASSRRDQRVHALIFVDVDRFKAINDSLGHGTGDDLLVAIGARMKQTLRSEDLLARFGGDEFVILLEDVESAEDAVNTARRICAAVEEPLVLSDGYEIVASVSVGVALTEPGQTADDILRDADVAMYKAKGRGGTYQLFDRVAMGFRSSERIDLEAALRKGLEREELEVRYQPLVSVTDLQVVGAEALVRWNHPVEGLLGPDRFIPMAEETGLILPLGQYVLEQACQQIRSIRDRLGVDIPVSVNLSPRQFQQSGLLSDVATALDRAGLPSDLLIFEITETMVMDDLGGATEIMKKLNRLGIRLAIDDFGTGHSSLGYLKRFPVHEVKVDRMFVQGLGSDPVDSAIVRSVVDLADAMRITAVAEGVETKEQLAGLRMLGCHVAQGYLFSRPLPAAEFDSFLDSRFAPPSIELTPPKAALRAV